MRRGDGGEGGGTLGVFLLVVNVFYWGALVVNLFYWGFFVFLPVVVNVFYWGTLVVNLFYWGLLFFSPRRIFWSVCSSAPRAPRAARMQLRMLQCAPARRARPECCRTLQDAPYASVCSRVTRRAQPGCSGTSERSECLSMLHCFSLVEHIT